MQSENNPLLGKTVVKLFLADDKEAMKFELAEGDPIIVRVDADCCSQTWIETIQNVEQLLGSPVVSVEDIEMPDLTPAEQEYGDVTQYYGLRITTEKGYTVIDYRNTSNGYYGGGLCWPGDYFYEGVFRQNVSKMQWVEVLPEPVT